MWKGKAKSMDKWTETLIHLNDVEILIGYSKDGSPIFDLFIVVAKMHIYTCKLFGCVPIVQGFKTKMKISKSLEKYTSTKNNDIDKYNMNCLITTED